MILTCGPVTAVGPYASVVGAPPQWADDLDSTYVNFPFEIGGSGVVSDYAEASLVGTPVTGVISATLTIRCTNTDPSGSLLRATVIGEDGASVTTGLFSQPTGTVTQQLIAFNGTNIAAVFGQPAELRITWAAGAGGAYVRVLEAYVLTLGDVPAEPPVITAIPEGVRRRFV